MSDLQQATERAATARAALALVVDNVRAGEWDLAAAFSAGDAEPLIGRCFAVKVIEVVPGIGKVRARRTMAELGLAEDVWLVDVSLEQRAAVISALEEAE